MKQKYQRWWLMLGLGWVMPELGLEKEIFTTLKGELGVLSR